MKATLSIAIGVCLATSSWADDLPSPPKQFTPVVAQAAEFPLECRYVANQPDAELEAHPACAARRGATLRIAPAHLRAMSFSTHGMAQAFIDGSWRYVNRAGRTLAVLTYDNGADDFAEGLVRSLVDGKVAFYDTSLRQIIKPRYDWAWPFEHGRALVCAGCRLGPPDAEGHRGLLGGRWGYINHRGQQVVPVTHTRDEASRL